MFGQTERRFDGSERWHPLLLPPVTLWKLLLARMVQKYGASEGPRPSRKVKRKEGSLDSLILNLNRNQREERLLSGEILYPKMKLPHSNLLLRNWPRKYQSQRRKNQRRKKKRKILILRGRRLKDF